MRKRNSASEGQKDEKRLTAGDIMSSWLLTVRDDMTLRELASFLTENEISGAPVVDEGGKLVGVVSLTDIVRTTAEIGETVSGSSGSGFYVLSWNGELDREDLLKMHVENEGLLVQEVMTPTLYTVSEGTPVSEIARTMLSRHVHRLLVTREEQVVGIVTTMDMLKLLVEKG